MRQTDDFQRMVNSDDIGYTSAMVSVATNTIKPHIWDSHLAFSKLHSRARETEAACCAGVTITKSLERIEIPQCIYDSCIGLGLLSKDPIGFAAGDTNLYRYVGNHGTYDTDPSGEIPPLVVAGFAAAYYFFGLQSAANAPATPEEAGDYGQSRKNLEGIISVSTLPLGGAAYKRAAGYGGNVLTRAIYGGTAGGVTHKLSTDSVSPVFLPNSGITTYGERPWETAGDYGTSILFWTGGGLIGEGLSSSRSSMSGFFQSRPRIQTNPDASLSFDADVAKILNTESEQFARLKINESLTSSDIRAQLDSSIHDAYSNLPKYTVPPRELGVPFSRSIDKYEPVRELDAHGNEIHYRSMSESHFELLQQTGMLPATFETSISPLSSYSANYRGITARIATAPGTSAKLQEIGIAANEPTAGYFPHMSTQTGSWMQTNARFKFESNQMTTQLGQGKALEIYNQNIIHVGRER